MYLFPMSKRHFGLSRILYGLVLLIALSFIPFCCLNAQQDRHPNIILILADDLGLGDIGCYAGKYETPNIDRIAEEGMRFTDYYSASPICSPSRAGILTGRFPAALHFTTFLNTKADNKRKEQVDFLDPNVPSVAKLLKERGYTTGHFGKWHLGGGRDVDNAPNFDRYGFDVWASTYESPDPDPAITATKWIWSDQDSIKRWNRTAYFVDRTLEFLKENKERPCYVNLWTDDVHTPWVAGDDENGRYPGKPQDEESFKAVLMQFDKQIGRLMDGLKELGLDENTLVIFTSDNGPLPNFRQDRSAGLRGSKLSLYEGGIRLPFIVRWPSHIQSNRVDSVSLLAAVDLLPSFLALAGTPKHNVPILDGEDRSMLWFGQKADRSRPLVWEYGRNSHFGFPKEENKSPALALREGRWKLLMDADGGKTELYDLEKDPRETLNLANEQPRLVQDLKKYLSNWWRSLPQFISDN
ncbi:sulfatase-like hydrolase/transferase [Sphingobacterium sp. LRF_L2]|uniref:sulfatase-like hydrolase/transferase n=1 Tax=Sphingobacterium sp. LRF_L2 TaxID=3369421 RepID=UPI003F6449A4